MAESARLGGFKVLKDVVRISLVSPKNTGFLPVRLLEIIAAEKINLPYLTIVSDGSMWGLNVVVEAGHEGQVGRLTEKDFGRVFTINPRSAILSIFPHRKNPDISGRLFEAFAQQGLQPEALANSPSAISVVVKEDLLSTASHALFEPFSFGAYRTPEDWKLAQKGKERLYKEVVASYQERRPGVYGLEYQDGQELILIKVPKSNMALVGSSLRGFARLGLDLTFLASSPCLETTEETLALCLPLSEGRTYTRVLHRMEPDLDVGTESPVVTFSMNGPHFGDRYGIVSELLASFERCAVTLLALSCTVASITGVVANNQWESAVQAIQECFEVPTISKRD